MTQNEINYSTMCNNSIAILDDYENTWKNNTKTSSKIANVKSTLSDIATLAKQQGLNTKGATGDKNTAINIAGEQAFHVDSVLKSYYTDNKDDTNYAIINFSMTDFLQGNLQTKVANMQLVYDKAAAIVEKTPTALANFNLEDTDLPELQTDIIAIGTAATVTPKMKARNKSITDQINQKFTLLRTQVNELDNNINTFGKKSPKMVSDYKNGRKIVHVGTGHNSVQLALMPVHFEATFGKEFTIGDSFLIRNHSAFDAKVATTNSPEVLPVDNWKNLPANSELRFEVPKDFGDVLGHWLIIYNPNEFDDVNVTVLMKKG